MWRSGCGRRGARAGPRQRVHLHGDWSVCCEHYACGVLGLGPDDVTFSSSSCSTPTALKRPDVPVARRRDSGSVSPANHSRTSFSRPLATSGRRSSFPCRRCMRRCFSRPSAPHMTWGASDLRSRRPSRCLRRYVRWQERFGIEILDGIGSTEYSTSTLVSPGSRQTRQFRPGGSRLPGANRRCRRQRRSAWRHRRPPGCGREPPRSGYWRRRAP